MHRKNTILWMAVVTLFCLGFAKTSFAQPTINSATMTLIDNDGNGYANIGDEIEITVVVDDAVSGTSVRIDNNDIFPGVGPFNLTKVTSGFGNGIEYSLTMPVIEGTTHDGEDPGDVNFTIQVRLGGVTQDDQTDLNISGVTETIDNVLPALSNSDFDDLGAGGLVTGDAYEISIDATDDSGIATVTADLRRLGLGESVTIPFDVGDTYTLDSEEIQEAQNQDQVSLNDSRSIVFTVTDEAGNTITYDSDNDGQTQNVDNVSPSAPVVVAVQRASDFNNSQDMFDIVITNGENPLDENDDPLLDEFGNVITFESLMAGGNYDVYWNGGDGVADDLLTTSGFNTNGVLVQVNFQFSEYAEGETLLFRVVPVKASGLEGEDEEDDAVSQRGVVEAEITTPEEGYLVGNLPSNRFEVHAQMDAGLTNYELLNSRVYVRDLINPAFQEWIDMTANQDGTLSPQGVVTANTLAGSGFSQEFEAVARPQFRINGVNLRVLTPAIAFQNNPVRNYDFDAQNPDVTLVSLNGDMGVGGFFDIEADGEVEFEYTITDNYAMDHDVATITVRFLDSGTGSELLSIGPNTINTHINNGMLSVDGDDFTFTYDVSTLPMVSGDPVFEVRANDGRGNQSGFTGSAQFTLLDDIDPAFVWTNPVPGTQFFNTITYNLIATDQGTPSANFTGYTIQFAETSDFATPYNIRTNTVGGSNTINGSINLNNLPITFITLVDGETYYVRAIIDKNPTQTTQAVPIVYNESGPMVDLDIQGIVDVNGQDRISGTVNVDIVSDDDINNVSVRARRPNTTFSVAGVSNISPSGFTINTTNGNLANNMETMLTIEVFSQDALGNSTTQFFNIFADNIGPNYTITSINGSGSLSSPSSIVAGDDITVVFDVISTDFDGDANFTMSQTIDGTTVVIESDVSVDGQEVTAVFTAPPSTADYTLNVHPNTGNLTAVVSDIIGNTNGSYSGPAIGNINVVGTNTPTALFTNMRNEFILNGNVTGIAFQTTGGVTSVRLEQRREGLTGNWTLINTTAPGNTFNWNTTGLNQGNYDLRLVAVAGGKEFISDEVTITVDNLNNRTTERATIVDMGGARQGGTSIELRAEAGSDVGGVEFRARRTGGGAGFTVIDGTTTRDGSNTFVLVVEPQDLVNAGLAGSISALDGEFEFKAVGFDRAGHEFEKEKGNTPSYNTGNADVANEVTRTFVVFDFTAPTGIASYGGQAMPNGLNWNTQTTNNFRMLSGEVGINAELQNDDGDFERVRITLERFGARTPGSGVTTYPGGDEVTIANLTDSDNLDYTLDTSTLKRGGIYQIRIYFEDDLGNTSIGGNFQFVVGEPQVRIAGFNPVKQQLYLSGPIHALSALVEYSTDGGSSFSTLGTYDLSIYGAAARDHARQATVSLTNADLPDGEIIFRATGADRTSGNYSEARFANSPSTLTVSSSAVNLQSIAQQHSRPASFLSSAWDPGSNGGNIGLTVNKEAGDLSSIRMEITPSSNDQEVSLFMMVDTNPYAADDGTVSTGLYTVNTVTGAGDTDFFAGRLEELDGNNLGFLDDNDVIDLTPGGTNISAGGVLYVFATTVDDNGEVDMRMERIMVHRVAANRGGVILASDNSTPIVSIEENVLDKNAGIYVEEDRARFRSTNAAQLNMGQLGAAYWISSPNGAALRSGMSSRIAIPFDPDELGEIPPERINIANVAGNQFTFNTNARDKRIDTLNNTIRFNLNALPGTSQRYTLVVDGLQTDNDGSIEVAEMMIGNAASRNYTSSSGTFSAIIADNISGIDPTTALLYINNTRINVTSTLISGGATNNTYQFNAGLNNLSLREGAHRARFLVENNSGDRLNRELEFYVDNTPLQIKNEVAVVGAASVVSFTAYDPPVADTLSAAGLDSSTVFIDIWGTKLEDGRSTTYRVLNRLSPGQLEFSGRTDSVQVAFNLPSDVMSSNFENLMFVIHNQPGVQLTDTLGLSQYGAGPADLAGNTLGPIVFTSVFDRTPPEIEVISSTVETGIRFRVTDDKSGVDPESIELEVIDPIEGTSVVYHITDEELTYNPSNGNLIFNTEMMGAEIILSVADQVNNVAVEDIIAESEFLTIAELYNYPNPFNPDHGGATITFMLSKSAVVDIELFDFIGRRASRVMQNESLTAGRNTIPLAGQAGDGRTLANGVYFLRVVARDGDRREEQVFKTVVAK